MSVASATPTSVPATAQPGQPSAEALVVLLYEQLETELTRAAAQIAARDLQGKSDSLARASAIVFELLGSLDHARGGELAPRLAGLYAWFAEQLMVVGRTLDLALLERMTGMVRTLHQSWRQAAATVGAAREGAGR